MRALGGQVNREVVASIFAGRGAILPARLTEGFYVSDLNIYDIHRSLDEALSAVHQLDRRISLILIEHTDLISGS